MIMRLLALLLFVCSGNSFAAAKIDHWQTPQGSRVYYVHTESLPMVDIQVIFDAGSARDGQQFGIAALTARLLSTGAGKWNADAIAQRFENVGALFNADVNVDMAVLSLRSLTDKALLDPSLETMHSILTQPSFNEADFKRERARTLAALKQQQEKPAAVASIAYSNTLYGSHPYGQPVTYRKDPDYFNLYLGNHILGGSGLVSKLFDEVREKRGLAYHASSSFTALLKPGPFTASLQTRNDQTTQALEILNKTLTDFVNQGPSETELTAAKQNVIGGFPMRFDTNKKLATYVGMIGFYEMPLDYLDTFPQKMSELTVATISDAFKRRVNLNTLQTVTVGKAQSGK